MLCPNSTHGVLKCVVPWFFGEYQWLSTSVFSPSGFSVRVTSPLAPGPYVLPWEHKGGLFSVCWWSRQWTPEAFFLGVAEPPAAAAPPRPGRSTARFVCDCLVHPVSWLISQLTLSICGSSQQWFYRLFISATCTGRVHLRLLCACSRSYIVTILLTSSVCYSWLSQSRCYRSIPTVILQALHFCSMQRASTLETAVCL